MKGETAAEAGTIDLNKLVGAIHLLPASISLASVLTWPWLNRQVLARTFITYKSSSTGATDNRALQKI